MSRAAFFVAAVAVWLASASPALAQTAVPPPPVLQQPPILDDAVGPVVVDIRTIDPETFRAVAARLPDGQTPRIDGRLDDPEWQLAPVQAHFVQREPMFGWESTERTQFRILYNDKTLYFGIWAYDDEADLIRASEMKRDSLLRKSDTVKIVIDTFHDHRNAFYFATNPLGALKDAQAAEDGRTINYDWNAVWENRTSIDAEGWYAEIAIPLSQLRFQGGPGDTVWGLNLSRVVMRKSEETYWVPYPREWAGLGFARMSGAGVLVGLRDLQPRRRFELVPFVTPSVVRNYDAGTSADPSAGYGFDLRVGLTSTFNADVTYKTDFAQVEADREVVNLSRFSLFFPEKRQFFTESAGIFDYGRAGGTLIGPGLLPLFYSRRIGLQSGREVPILAGGRVTGRSGPVTLGMMNIATEATRFGTGDAASEIASANYTVMRVKADVMANSSIGGIFLNREGGTGADFNRTAGIDGLFTLGTHLDLSVLAAKTFSPGSGGKDWAGAVDVGWKSDRFDYGATYVDIAERFNAEMGFIQRTDIRNARASAAWTPRPRWSPIRQLRLGGTVSYIENHAGRVESKTSGLGVSVMGQDMSSLRINADRSFDYLPFNWSTAGGVIPLGGYSWNRARVTYTTNQSRRVSGSITADAGGYYSGNRQSYRASLNLLPLETLLVETGYSRNIVTLPATAPYTTNVASSRVSYSFSPDLFVKSYIQYNDASRNASLNLLFWYIYRPGSDFYIVYNEGWETDLPGPRDIRVRGRSLAIKMTYWLSR